MTTMQQWQIEALEAILETETTEVEAGSRVYLSSETYGKSRYHLLEKRYDGLQVEQVDIEEKWNKRINLYTDELPALLKTLLDWYLEKSKKSQAPGQEDADEPLGDLEDHPF